MVRRVDQRQGEDDVWEGCAWVVFWAIRGVCRVLGVRPPGRLKEPGEGGDVDVKLSDPFITPAEQVFFRVLVEAVGSEGARWHVLAQVALNRIVRFPGNAKTPGRQAWVNKTSRRSVDFLVIDRRTTRPLVAIELDDASHRRGDRQRRDAEVEAVLADAGLPLVRLSVSKSYDVEAIRETLRRHLVARPDAD